MSHTHVDTRALRRPPVLCCCAPPRQGTEGLVPTCSAVGRWQVSESSEGGPDARKLDHLVHALEGSTGAPEPPFSFLLLLSGNHKENRPQPRHHATMMCRPKATMPRGRELQSWILQGQRNLYYLKSVSSQFLYSTAMETKGMWKVGVAALAVFSSYNPPLLLLLFSPSSPMSFWTREPESKVELKFPVKWKICFDASSSVLSTSVNGCVWTGPASQGSWPSQAALQPPRFRDSQRGAPIPKPPDCCGGGPLQTVKTPFYWMDLASFE